MGLAYWGNLWQYKSFNDLYQCSWEKIQNPLHDPYSLSGPWLLLFFPASSCTIPNPSPSVLRNTHHLTVPWPYLISSCHRSFALPLLLLCNVLPPPHTLSFPFIPLILQILIQVSLPQKRFWWTPLLNPTPKQAQARESSLLHSLSSACNYH